MRDGGLGETKDYYRELGYISLRSIHASSPCARPRPLPLTSIIRRSRSHENAQLFLDCSRSHRKPVVSLISMDTCYSSKQLCTSIVVCVT